jgi:diguanylate cyclase (GGDEF)-like protein
MSFRNLLRLFFGLIVVVPMIAVGVVVFRLVGDNQQGKAGARLEQAQRDAIGLYRHDRQRAGRLAARLVQHDMRFQAALRAGDRAAARARARVLVSATPAVHIRVTRNGHRSLSVGARAAIAPASTTLATPGGRTVAKLQVSVTRAPAYAATLHAFGLQAVVRRGGRTLAGTLRTPPRARLPSLGKVTLGTTTYHVASFRAPDLGGRQLTVHLLADAHVAGSTLTRDRLLAGGVLLGFVILAFGGALLISRTLQDQIARFLAAARRVAGGDFSQSVPAEGNDEFAALGSEFNKMSAQLAARLEELDAERARLRSSIRRIGASFAGNLDADALTALGAQTAVDAVQASCARVTMRARGDQALRERSRVGSVQGFQTALQEAERRALREHACAQVTVAETSALAAPLRRGDETGRLLGLLSAARRDRPFDEGERELFASLAAQAGTSLENVALHEQVQRQAVTDELTGLHNARRFHDLLEVEVERARRFDQPLGLLMLDIDDFKPVNDTHGHLQGDDVLRAVGHVLAAGSREIDEPARYGGEEMAVVLPQTDLDGAVQLAERIRGSIADLRVPRRDGTGVLRVTVSCGAAALPDSALDKGGLIAAADAALYRAKRAGKDRTERAAGAAIGTTPSGR